MNLVVFPLVLFASGGLLWLIAVGLWRWVTFLWVGLLGCAFLVGGFSGLLLDFGVYILWVCCGCGFGGFTCLTGFVSLVDSA